MMRRGWTRACIGLLGMLVATLAAAEPSVEQLEAAGYPGEHFALAVAWSEAPAHGEAIVHGYRLEPLDGAPAFDVYLDEWGLELDAAAQAVLGITPKRWHTPGTGATFELARPEAAKARSAPTPALVRHALPVTAEWALAPLDPRAVEKRRAENDLSKEPALIGLVRDADTPITMVGGAPSLGHWQALPGGREAWAVQVHDPGAVGLRLHLDNLHLSADAQVLVYDAYNPGDRYAVTGREGEAWSPTVYSDTIILEVVVGADAVATTGFTLAAAGHVFVDPLLEAATKQAGACNLDVTCHGDYLDVAAAVGWTTYIKGISLFACTGALIADTVPDTQTPLFMTANHCVSTQEHATTIEVYWFYQTAQCNGSPPGLGTLPRSNEGATLLSTSTRNAGTDHTLVLLAGSLPAGVAFLGWDGEAASFGTQVVGVHHPRSSFKRIAFGPLTDCASQTTHSCPVNGNRFYEVTWQLGVTEGGSSGSPILRANSKEFLGTLWGGFAACDATVMTDYYGRFEVTLPMVAAWLDPNPPQVVISTNGGGNFKTPSDSVALSGTVSSTATKVEVNGAADGVTHTPGSTAWNYIGSLTEGPNLLTVTAFAGSASTSVAITVTRDTNPPVLTLNGPNPDFVELGGVYEDPGATAVDPEEGPVAVTVSGTVANAPIGAESTLVYEASDSVGNTAQAERTVIVMPGEDDPPILTITTDGGNGPGQDYATALPALLLEGTTTTNTVTLRVNDSAEGVHYEPGAFTWTFEGELIEGPNAFTVTAASAGGHEASLSITILLDSTPPVITLLGSNPDTVFVGETYIDPGAEATDDHDGPVAVTVSGSVVSTPEGRNSVLTYRAVDALGNAAERTRTVVAVVDDTKPPIVAITTNGGVNFATREAAITIAGTVTSNATDLFVNGAAGGVNFTPGSIPWSFETILQEGPNGFVITADSAAGESAPVVIIIVLDTVPPVITLLGDNPDSVELDAAYIDPGATAVDDRDGAVPVQVSGVVVNAPLGASSTLTYTASDSLGNQSVATRTVVVTPEFSNPPDVAIITNNGANFSTNITLLALAGTVTTNATEVRVNGSAAGVAFTPLDEAWSAEVTLAEGLNPITVQAFGPGGPSPVRTLFVRLDTNPPVITLTGANPYFVPLDGPYSEPGATASDPEDGALPVTVSGDVATSPLGAESSRTYRAQDAAGNVTEVTRTIIVGADDAVARVRLGSGVAPSNGLLLVPIVLLPGDAPVAFLDFTVQYNFANLRFDRLDTGPAALFAGATFQTTSLGSGQLRIRVTGAADNGGALVPGVLAHLVMSRGDAPLPTATPMSAPLGSGTTADGKSLTVLVDGATGHFLAGTLGPDSDGDGLPDAAEAVLGSDPGIFDSNGNGYADGFEVVNGSDPVNPEITPIPLPLTGDVNIDAKVDSIDVQFVINGALGIRTPMPTDITGSGSTNATDVQTVINAALGIGVG